MKYVVLRLAPDIRTLSSNTYAFRWQTPITSLTLAGSSLHRIGQFGHCWEGCGRSGMLLAEDTQSAVYGYRSLHKDQAEEPLPLQHASQSWSVKQVNGCLPLRCCIWEHDIAQRQGCARDLTCRKHAHLCMAFVAGHARGRPSYISEFHIARGPIFQSRLNSPAQSECISKKRPAHLHIHAPDSST